MGRFENGRQEVAMGSGHIQLKYILPPPRTWRPRNSPLLVGAECHLQNLCVAWSHLVIGGGLCSSDWHTVAILLKIFEDTKPNPEDGRVSAADSSGQVVALWAGTNAWTLALPSRS